MTPRLPPHLQQTFAKNTETKKYGSKTGGAERSRSKTVINGATIFSSLCASCHGSDGQGVATQVAPPLVSKFKLVENKKELIKILLHGLTGPVEGKTYPDNMPPMNANDDEWIASVTSYIRFELCIKSFPKMPENYLNWVMVRPDDVEKIRKKYESRKKPWTWEEMRKEKEKEKREKVNIRLRIKRFVDSLLSLEQIGFPLFKVNQKGEHYLGIFRTLYFEESASAITRSNKFFVICCTLLSGLEKSTIRFLIRGC